MKRNPRWPTSSLIVALIMLLSLAAASRKGISPGEENYESTFASLKGKVSADRIREGVYYLSADPLPRRVLNYALPGHTASTLEEADAWIIGRLRNAGYSPKTDATRVQAFGRDRTGECSE